MNKNTKKKLPFKRILLLPSLFLLLYAFIGYCAIDKQRPKIISNSIDVLYGTDLTPDLFTITDNRIDQSLLDVEINDINYNKNQVGTYDVEVSATDQFSNTETKWVKVNVIDETAPVISLKKDNGYLVDMEVNSQFDPKKYFVATDNSDGDITDRIVCSTHLDSKNISTQVVDVTVADSYGNVTTKSFEFNISDSTAPVIKVKSSTVVINYGSRFNYRKYVSVKDNYDGNVNKVKVIGKIDTKKLNDEEEFKVQATDSSGNVSEVKFKAVVKDISAPTISLKKNKVTIEKGKSVNLKALIGSVTDNHDGNCKDKVKISGSVNNKKAGKYTVTYTVTDKAGNTSSKIIKVEVTNPNDVASNMGIISTAKTRLGSPYRYGSTGPTSFDCSGFTQWVYRKNGKSIPRSSGAQNAAGKKVSLSQLKPGDIVWRPGHVGIYVGGGTVIHAPRPGKSVSYTTLSMFKHGVRY